MKEKRIDPIFRTPHGFARTKALLEGGIHPRQIKRLAEEGQLIRVKRGLYRLAEVPLISHQGFVDLACAVPDGVICLLSALSYFDMTTFNPSVISMAIRRGKRLPPIQYPPVEFYSFSPKPFEAGIEEIQMGSMVVRMYCPEKTICDCFRYRNKLGLDIAKEGLTEYLKRKDRHLEKLMEYAAICRVKPILQTWLFAMI